ncbi:MAG: SAM-dependent methyltransferase [Pseudomonadota bacterium]
MHAVPGAAAVVAALSVAGLPTDAFMFAGFLPPKTAARRTRITALAQVPATLCLYEAPHRLGDTLNDFADILGPRQAVVARELTKRFETVETGSLVELAERFAAGTKGEIVILIAPPGAAIAAQEDAAALLAEALTRLQPSAAAAEVAKRTGRPRRELYRMAVAQKPDTQ